MNLRNRRPWIVVSAVVTVCCVAIAMGYAALNSPLPMDLAGKTTYCCCNFQCVPSTNGACPSGCFGPSLICPDRCRPPY